MHPIEIVITAIVAILMIAALGYEILDWREGTHPF